MTALSVSWGYTDMFIRKFTYDSMLDLISMQAKEIIELHDQVRTLKSDLKRSQTDLLDLQRFCINYAADNHDFIDFPNSTKGGFEGSDIFTL